MLIATNRKLFLIQYLKKSRLSSSFNVFSETVGYHKQTVISVKYQHKDPLCLNNDRFKRQHLYVQQNISFDCQNR